jgi:hypothetical protein
LGSTIGTNPETKFAANALILVNQGDARFDIFINGRSGTSRDARRIKAMHAAKWKEILIYLFTTHLRPNSMYSDELRAFRIANREFCGVRC